MNQERRVWGLDFATRWSWTSSVRMLSYRLCWGWRMLKRDSLPEAHHPWTVASYMYLAQGGTSCKTLIFKLPPLKGIKSLRLYTWLIDTPTLLLKKFNIRKCSYVLTWNGGASKRGIKVPILNRVWYLRSLGTNRKWAGYETFSECCAMVEQSITVPCFKPVAITQPWSYAQLKTKIQPMCEVPPFLNPVTYSVEVI